ncbi:MAG: AbrB/MazE/SpoVT family DNA-binding domain-containing protein [Bacillota bacterium]
MKKLKLTKTGQIYIPNCIRSEIDLACGDYIYIYIDGKKIVLTNKEGYEKENRSVFSENGTVHIPTEIRRLLNINSEAVFSVTLNKREMQINLIPDT